MRRAFAHCGAESAHAVNYCTRAPRKVVAKAGIEPATHGFSVRCSTN
jgi:hypothetical protein